MPGMRFRDPRYGDLSDLRRLASESRPWPRPLPWPGSPPRSALIVLPALLALALIAAAAGFYLADPFDL